MIEANTFLPSGIVKKAARMSDNQMIHFRQLAESDDNMAAVLPGKPEATGKPRLFDPERAALACLMADLVASDVKAPLAAKIARRVMVARETQPEVMRWVIVATDNGHVSTLPYNHTDLATGFISGARLRFALVIDWETYCERVAEAIADAPKIIGGGDES